VIASIQGRVSQGTESRLEVLFGDISRAVGEGRLEVALRLADCACRAAPEDLTCVVVYAQLLIKVGAAGEAVDRLEGRQEPDAVLVRAEALCAQGLLDDAASACGMLLSRRAVDSFESLRSLAARLCCIPGGKSPGWMGVETGFRLVGQVLAGNELRIALGNSVFHPSISPADSDGLGSFTFEVPSGVSGRLVVCTGGSKLLGSDQSWPPEFGFSGWVVAENRMLVGKVGLDWAPLLPVTLTIGRYGSSYLRRVVVPSSCVSSESPISVPLDSIIIKENKKNR